MSWRENHAKVWGWFLIFAITVLGNVNQRADRRTGFRVKWYTLRFTLDNRETSPRAGTNSMRPIEPSSTVAGTMAGSRCTPSPSTNGEPETKTERERKRNHDAKYDEKIGISLADNQYYHARKYDRARVRIDLFQESRDSLINGPIKYLLITAVSHLIRATIEADSQTNQWGKTKADKVDWYNIKRNIRWRFLIMKESDDKWE